MTDAPQPTPAGAVAGARRARRSSAGRRRRIARPIVFGVGLLAGALLAFAFCYLWATGSFSERSTEVGSQVVTIPKGAVVTFEGDSITYGLQRLTWSFHRLPPINGAKEARSATPFPEVFERDLAGNVGVVNHGYPGFRVTDAEYYWRKVPTTALTVIMLGTNDSNTAGRKGIGVVPLDTFRRTYAELIDRRLRDKGAVLLLLPPTRRVDDELLQQYRDVIIQLAAERHVPYIDTRSILSRFPIWTLDGVHPTDAGYVAIGDYLTGAIRVR